MRAIPLATVALLLAVVGLAIAQEGTLLYPHRDGSLDARAPTATSDAVLKLGGGAPISRDFTSPRLGAPVSLADGASLWVNVRSAAGVGLGLEAVLLLGSDEVARASVPLQPSAMAQDVVMTFPASESTFEGDERILLTLSLVGNTAAAPVSSVEIAYDSTAHPAALNAPRTALPSSGAPLAALLPESIGGTTANVPWLMLGLLVGGMLLLIILAVAALLRGVGGARRAIAWSSLIGAPLALAGVGAAALVWGYSAELGAAGGALFAALAGATGASHPGSRGLAGALRTQLARIRSAGRPIRATTDAIGDGATDAAGSLVKEGAQAAEPAATALGGAAQDVTRRVPVRTPTDAPVLSSLQSPLEPPDELELERALERWGVKEAKSR